MGYPASLLRGIIPTHYLVVTTTSLITFSMTTIIQLCISRYLIINGHDRFPWKYKILMAFFYVGVGALSIQIGRSHADEKVIIEEYSQVSCKYVLNYFLLQQYSCITPDLFNISGFIIYDNLIFIENTMALMVLFLLSGSFAGVYFVVMSYRTIRVSHMSPQLARLQRKLIVTLILQIMIPLFVMGIPLSIYQIILFFKIMNTGTGEWIF